MSLAARPDQRIPRLAELPDVAAVVALHRERFPNGFLPTLGSRPLRYLYRHIVASSDGFVLVSEDEDGVNGFVAVSTDTRKLYRGFLRTRALVAGLVAAPAVLRAPRKVWETLRYGNRSDTRGLPAAEILAIAVAEHARGTGAARSLVTAALGELRARGVRAVRVVTAVGNASALRLYEEAGFRRERRTEVHRGIPQEVLVWP